MTESSTKDLEKMTGGQAIGYVGGGVLLIVFFSVAVIAEQWSLNLLYVLVPLILGWAAGILFTPTGQGQATQFGAIAGGVAALFSGFIIGRFEPLLEPLKSPSAWTPLYQERLLLAVGSFILGALFTSIGRIANLNPFKN